MTLQEMTSAINNHIEFFPYRKLFYQFSQVSNVTYKEGENKATVHFIGAPSLKLYDFQLEYIHKMI